MEPIRIKYVAFYYDNKKYIVNMEKQEISFADKGCTVFQKLFTTLVCNKNKINKSYTISFELSATNKMAEITVYDNCIEHCSIVINDIKECTKTILDKNMYNFDYFTISNILDENKEIKVFTQYSDIFEMSKDELKTELTEEQVYDILYDLLQVTKKYKNDYSVQEKLLTNIRNILDNKNIISEEGNETE